MELSSVNELLDRITALGVTTDYDQVGLKPDLREINSPQVTHHVAMEDPHAATWENGQWSKAGGDTWRSSGCN